MLKKTSCAVCESGRRRPCSKHFKGTSRRFFRAISRSDFVRSCLPTLAALPPCSTPSQTPRRARLGLGLSSTGNSNLLVPRACGSTLVDAAAELASWEILPSRVVAPLVTCQDAPVARAQRVLQKVARRPWLRTAERLSSFRWLLPRLIALARSRRGQQATRSCRHEPPPARTAGPTTSPSPPASSQTIGSRRIPPAAPPAVAAPTPICA
jgi:hypothetical protein